MHYILALFLLEIVIFLTEILFSAFNKKNQELKRVSSMDQVDFIDLSVGYRTSISFFRVSIFICYLILVFIHLDISDKNSFEKYFMIGITGILIYLFSLYNIKIFINETQFSRIK